MNEHLVEAAFRALLGRDPENTEVVAALAAATHGDAEAILRAFVASDEFRARHSGFMQIIEQGYSAPRLPVETRVSDAVLNRFFVRIKAQWTKLGYLDPFYSVLTHDEYRKANFGKNAERFYASGAATAAMVDYFAARNAVTLNRGRCVELGCGVGRVTRYLAERFDEVVAVDISEGNLSHCRAYMEREGVANVAYHMLYSPADIGNIPTADYFYSVITLQHNPPPVQLYLLEEILKKLNRGAACLFQTPTSGINYTFNASEYLDSEPQEMEVHCVPMHAVLGLLQQHDFVIKEVAIDAQTGSYGSHTFFAQKR